MHPLNSWLFNITVILVLCFAGQQVMFAEQRTSEEVGQQEDDSDRADNSDDSWGDGGEISPEEEAIEFMEGICGPETEIEVKKGDRSPRRATCSECPEEGEEGEIYARWGVRGNFLRDGSKTAFLLVGGCIRRFFLLRKEEQDTWTVVTEGLGWMGFRKIEGDQQDILLRAALTGLDSGKYISPILGRRFRVVYLQEGKIKEEMIKEIAVHSRTSCKCGGDVGKELEEVILEDLSGDGRDELALGFKTVLPADREIDGLDVECTEELGEYVENTHLYIWEFGPDGLERRRDIETSTEHPSLERYRSNN